MKRLVKGSAAAKAFMAKIRAKKGTATKKIGNDNDKYCIDYLNKAKGFAKDRVCFDTWKEAIDWGRKNLGNFHSDMINGVYKENKKTPIKKPAKKVGSTLKLDKKEMRLGMPPKTTSRNNNKYHKDTKSHNVRISVVSGVKCKSLIGNVSNRKKIDILNFTKPEMVARLFLIVKDWSRLDDKIVLNKARALVWSRNTARENFIYPKIYEKKLTYNLLLYVMGNNNNLFSEAIK